MPDPRIFAVLTPYDPYGLATEAFCHPHNKFGHEESMADPIRFNSGQDSETVCRSPPITETLLGPTIIHRIVLRLHVPPKNRSQGWRFGTDSESCDFLLAGTVRQIAGVSSVQFRITVDTDHRVFLHDERSRYGTRISHDTQGQNRPFRNDKRVLCLAPRSETTFNSVVIHVGLLSFSIDFPNHKLGSGAYLANLNQYLATSSQILPQTYQPAVNSNLPGELLSREATSTDGGTPYYDGVEIGAGAYGSVCKVIDLREGELFAAKKFFKLDLDKRLGLLDRIRQEYTIMDQNRHVSLSLKAIPLWTLY